MKEWQFESPCVHVTAFGQKTWVTMTEAKILDVRKCPAVPHHCQWSSCWCFYNTTKHHTKHISHMACDVAAVLTWRLSLDSFHCRLWQDIHKCHLLQLAASRQMECALIPCAETLLYLFVWPLSLPPLMPAENYSYQVWNALSASINVDLKTGTLVWHEAFHSSVLCMRLLEILWRNPFVICNLLDILIPMWLFLIAQTLHAFPLHGPPSVFSNNLKC